MSGNGKNGDSGSRRKPFRSKNNESFKNKVKKNSDFAIPGGGRLERKKISLHERPKWTAPIQSKAPLPTVSCAWCDKPIKDIATAISEPETNKPVHFDCVINRITEKEYLEKGDSIYYLGGGRFGIIHLNNPQNTKNFSIKKVFEWEDKENRGGWRDEICSRFSVT